MNGHSSVKVEVNKPEFRKATLLDGEMYEIEKRKKKITLDVPVQIGFTILNYAKLRMLEFYYSVCVNIFLEPNLNAFRWIRIRCILVWRTIICEMLCIPILGLILTRSSPVIVEKSTRLIR